MAKSNRAITKTEKSVRQYIEQLHDQNSKLLVLRVDLGYTKEHGKDMQLADIKGDAKHLLDNRRSNPTLFEHQVGYIMKFENTPAKGPHIHALFLYDGQQVIKDAYLADQVGRYWRDKITDGKGVYHNCNRDKTVYDQCGIGMINHTETDKRTALMEKVIPYMLKPEQSIANIKETGDERSVTKGVITSRKNNVGRPRVQSLQQS
jgi:hypothetical protein